MAGEWNSQIVRISCRNHKTKTTKILFFESKSGEFWTRVDCPGLISIREKHEFIALSLAGINALQTHGWYSGSVNA